VNDDEWSTGPQSPMDIGYGASAFLLGNEVQG